jgi:hypothetical protein
VFFEVNLGRSLLRSERRSGSKRTWETNADVCCVSVFVLQTSTARPRNCSRTMADLVDQGKDSTSDGETKEGE